MAEFFEITSDRIDLTQEFTSKNKKVADIVFYKDRDIVVFILLIQDKYSVIISYVFRYTLSLFWCIILSLGALLKVSTVERQVKKKIEEAKIRAKEIIEKARIKARDIQSRDNINRMVKEIVEKYKEEVEKKFSEMEYIEDEELERLGLIKDEELEEIADLLLEVIFSE